MLTHTHTQTSKKKRKENLHRIMSWTSSPSKKKKKRSSLGFLFILFLFSPLWEHPATHHLFISYFIQSLFNLFFSFHFYISRLFLSLFFSLSLENSLEKSYSALAWSAGHIQTDWKPVVHAIINMLVCLIIFKLLNYVSFIYSIWNCSWNYWFIVYGLILFPTFCLHLCVCVCVCVCDWTFII